MPQESRVMQSFKTFSNDINQALYTNLLSLDEAEDIGSALGVIQARLNTHRNTFAPINKLPAEVLGRIFEFAIAPEPEYFENLYGFPPSTPPPEAAQASYENLIFVCTRWSTIATSCPRMWYHIVDDDMADRDLDISYNPRAVLRRSGRATPLHLYMAVPPHSSFESVAQWVIKNQPVRVDSLYITVREDAPTAHEAILEALSTPFPSLRLLNVNARHFHGPVAGCDMPIILGGEASSVEALVWSLGVLFLPGNTFPDLAHLSLHERGTAVHDVRDLDRLLRLLSNCPRLETLVLSPSSLDIASGMGPGHGTVPLNHLRAVWIHGRYLLVEANSALTFLSYLELPADAIVRLSNLFELDPDEYDEPQPEEPLPARVPFLAQMVHPLRLDIIHCERGFEDDGDGDIFHFHFIVVGPRARFWFHLPAGRTVALRYMAALYKMLPKDAIETVRFSVLFMRDFAVLPLMLDHLSSLTTLLIRHSNFAPQNAALSGIAALSQALRPGRAPANDVDSDTSGERFDSSSEGSSDGYSDEGNTTHSSWESADDYDSDQIGHPDRPFDDAEQPPGAPAAGRMHHGNHIDSPVEPSGGVPVPQLKVLGLELKCAPTASLAPFVRAIAERKKRGHPLATVRCNLTGVERRHVEDMKEHVVDGVSDVDGKLWVPTVDEGWLVKNDYWRLYPVPWNNYAGWGLYIEEEW